MDPDAMIPEWSIPALAEYLPHNDRLRLSVTCKLYREALRPYLYPGVGLVRFPKITMHKIHKNLYRFVLETPIRVHFPKCTVVFMLLHNAGLRKHRLYANLKHGDARFARCMKGVCLELPSAARWDVHAKKNTYGNSFVRIPILKDNEFGTFYDGAQAWSTKVVKDYNRSVRYEEDRIELKNTEGTLRIGDEVSISFDIVGFSGKGELSTANPEVLFLTAGGKVVRL